MPRGPKLPRDNSVRDVPVLFPNTHRGATPEEIAFYSRTKAEHGAFYFGVERQSLKDELLRKDATGLIRRVQAIRNLAHVVSAWAPEPLAVESRQEGQLPFGFDRRFWFLDGEEKHATGYAANPSARPELWRAYRLTQALAEKGCGPTAIIVGEGTRLFRDPQ